MMAAVNNRIHDLQSVLRTTEDHSVTQLTEVAQEIDVWQTKVRSAQKSQYTALISLNFAFPPSPPPPPPPKFSPTSSFSFPFFLTSLLLLPLPLFSYLPSVLQVTKIKAIYHTMNQFNLDVTQRCLIAECWCPVEDLDEIQHALIRGTVRRGREEGVGGAGKNRRRVYRRRNGALKKKYRHLLLHYPSPPLSRSAVGQQFPQSSIV